MLLSFGAEEDNKIGSISKQKLLARERAAQGKRLPRI